VGFLFSLSLHLRPATRASPPAISSSRTTPTGGSSRSEGGKSTVSSHSFFASISPLKLIRDEIARENSSKLIHLSSSNRSATVCRGKKRSKGSSSQWKSGSFPDRKKDGDSQLWIYKLIYRIITVNVECKFIQMNKVILLLIWKIMMFPLFYFKDVGKVTQARKRP